MPHSGLDCLALAHLHLHQHGLIQLQALLVRIEPQQHPPHPDSVLLHAHSLAPVGVDDGCGFCQGDDVIPVGVEDGGGELESGGSGIEVVERVDEWAFQVHFKLVLLVGEGVASDGELEDMVGGLGLGLGQVQALEE